MRLAHGGIVVTGRDVGNVETGGTAALSGPFSIEHNTRSDRRLTHGVTDIEAFHASAATRRARPGRAMRPAEQPCPSATRAVAASETSALVSASDCKLRPFAANLVRYCDTTCHLWLLKISCNNCMSGTGSVTIISRGTS